MSIGTRLRRAREDAKLEQRDAAQRVGIHAVTLSHYENDKRPAPPETRQKLAALYGLPDDAFEIAGGDDPPTDTGPAPTIAIPLHELTYWRGVLETEHRHLQGLNQSMESLLGMLRDATKGIGGFIDAGILPAPPPSGRPSITREQAGDEIEESVARRKREREAADASAAAPAAATPTSARRA